MFATTASSEDRRQLGAGKRRCVRVGRATLRGNGRVPRGAMWTDTIRRAFKKGRKKQYRETTKLEQTGVDPGNRRLPHRCCGGTEYRTNRTLWRPFLVRRVRAKRVAWKQSRIDP